MSGRALITGFVGLRPTAAYSCIIPLAPWIKKEFGDTDVLLAATMGEKGSERFLEKLRELFEKKELCWKEPLRFSGDIGHEEIEKEVIDCITENFENYDKVFLFLKGGKGVWDYQLYRSVYCQIIESDPDKYYSIISDSNKSIVRNSYGKICRQEELASLGIQTFFELLRIKNVKKLNSGNGWEARGSRGKQSIRLPHLEEKAGFLRGLIDARGWRKNSNKGDKPYQNKLRLALNIADEIRLESGKTVFIIDTASPGSAAKLLSIRLKTLNIRFYEADKNTEEAKIINAAKRTLQRATPGGRNQVDNESLPEEFARLQNKKRGVEYQSKTLAMFVSNSGSSIPLISLYTHRPENLVIFYDQETTDNIVMAKRLFDSAEKAGCVAVATVPSDRMGRNIEQHILKLKAKKEFKGGWNFQLTPGTKEQGFAFIGEGLSCTKDSLWFYDNRKGAICLGSAEEVIKPAYPPLLETIRYCSGTLLEQPTEVGNLLTEEVKSFVFESFRHLEEVKWNQRLSADTRVSNTPIVDNNGTITLNTGHSVKTLHLTDNVTRKIRNNGSYDQNTWFEYFTAIALKLAGAGKIYWSVKWKWPENDKPGSFRDEIDVIASFGSDIVSISCKTGKECTNKEDLAEEIRQHSGATKNLLGGFTRTFVALPIVRSEQLTSEFPFADHLKEEKLLGNKTGVLGVNRLAHPKSLKEWLLANR